ncbi:methyltransferase family protein [Elioraea rosea]|uniref:methyltransferase family protein n=1 Tax=Elioraea rosea TaxID=2492390 RepID=UPI0011844D24|nr:isoprenylcysteine carboxylmethyltransferase family protein [Elioraea rosea]
MTEGLDDSPPPVAIHPPILYAAAFLAGLGLDRLLPLPAFFSDGVRHGAASMLLVFGTCFALWAAWLFHRAGTGIPTWQAATRFVQRGPYAISRNPMYLGVSAAYAGLALALASSWALILLVPVLVVMDRLVIAREEPYLAARFGPAYEAYLRRVRRWI